MCHIWKKNTSNSKPRCDGPGQKSWAAELEGPPEEDGLIDYQRWILSFQEDISNSFTLRSLSDIYEYKEKL